MSHSGTRPKSTSPPLPVWAACPPPPVARRATPYPPLPPPMPAAPRPLPPPPLHACSSSLVSWLCPFTLRHRCRAAAFSVQAGNVMVRMDFSNEELFVKHGMPLLYQAMLAGMQNTPTAPTTTSNQPEVTVSAPPTAGTAPATPTPPSDALPAPTQVPRPVTGQWPYLSDPAYGRLHVGGHSR